MPENGALLAEKLKLTKEQYVVTFQSRFGKAEWLQPYTAPTLVALAQQGVKRVDLLCPGFTSDCLEPWKKSPWKRSTISRRPAASSFITSLA